jgi:hypothetical protein
MADVETCLDMNREGGRPEVRGQRSEARGQMEERRRQNIHRFQAVGHG